MDLRQKKTGQAVRRQASMEVLSYKSLLEGQKSYSENSQ